MATTNTILVIEDERNISRFIAKALTIAVYVHIPAVKVFPLFPLYVQM